MLFRSGHVGTDEWNAAIGFLQGIVQMQALQAAFRDSFVILAIAFLLTLAPTLALRPRQRQGVPTRAGAAKPA